MFKTYVGATEDESSVTYLRPETAQSIFVQFKNVLEVARKKLPSASRNRESISQRDQSPQFHFPITRVRTDGTGIFLPAGAGDGAARVLEGRAAEVLREHRHQTRSPARQDGGR